MLKDKIKLSKSKIIVLIIASFVVLCTLTTGTYAWLSGKTSLLNSKFTYGDIKISISESDIDEDAAGANSYDMLPGIEIEKDPVITVLKKSEDCWLFVELNKSENFDDFMTYELVDGWILLEENTNVYYREVSKKTSNQDFYVIKDNVIKVRTDVTKQMLDSLEDNENYPTFTVSAYAVQRNSKIDALSTAEKAWLLVSNQE